jgi:hypothetical protein
MTVFVRNAQHIGREFSPSALRSARGYYIDMARRFGHGTTVRAAALKLARECQQRLTGARAS